MTLAVAEGIELKYNKLSVIPLGGQSEVGQVLFALSYAGELLLMDAGACYPGTDLPGVDLLLPNINFLKVNQARILALVLTNGSEEHCGAVAYLLNHLTIPRIMAPHFVCAMISQNLRSKDNPNNVQIDTVELKHLYQIGQFGIEWVQVNDAIADASALSIRTPEGNIIYTSSFKLDQTPVDNRLMDIANLAKAGDAGVTLLISDSAGVENPGYTPSEKIVAAGLDKHLRLAQGRVIVVLAGTNTHRIQILYNLAKQLQRRVVLVGETLIQSAVAAVVTGNLAYDRVLEAAPSDLEKLEDNKTLIIATGSDGDALGLFYELAFNKNKDLKLKSGDTVIFSAEIYPGHSRKMATILDKLLSAGIKAIHGTKDGVHVSNHASQEELKLLLAIIKPKFFVPAIGEGRHRMHHAQLALDVGMAYEAVFPLANGDILEISKGQATVIGSVEAEAVLYNRNQDESITTLSVNERRALSMEGILNIGCVISAEGDLLQQPQITGAALKFALSNDWQTVKEELIEAISTTIVTHLKKDISDKNGLRVLLKEIATKTIRSKLQAKPTINISIHEPLPTTLNN